MAKTLQYQALVEPIAPPLAIFVQSVAAFVTGASSLSVALSGVTPGNALIVGIARISTTLVIESVSDDNGDTFTKIGVSASTVNHTLVSCWIAQQVAGGSTSVTVNWPSNAGFALCLLEVAGIDDLFSKTNPALPNVFYKDNFDEGATTGTAHQSGGNFAPFTTDPAGTFIFCLGALNSAYGTVTAGPGYTVIPAGGPNQALFQYRIASASLVSERGVFTTDGVVSNCGLIIALRAGPHVPGGAPNPYQAAMQPQPEYQTPSPSSRFRQSDSFFSPLTVPSAPVGPTTAQIMAALQPQSPLAPPKAKFIGSDGSVAPIEPTLYVKQKLDWYVQHPEATKPRTPAQVGIYSEMVDPTLYVKVNMGWYVQHPGPTLYRQPMAHTLYVEPLVPIAPLKLLGETFASNVTVVQSSAFNVTIIVSSAFNPDT